MTDGSARICYVITDLQVGGVPLHLFRLANEMSLRGFLPVVVSLADVGPVGARLRESGIDVECCLGRGGWDVRVLSRLAGLLKRFKPDLVHSFLFHANVASRWAARRAGIPTNRILCEIQTVEVERRWHLWVDRWTHRGCRFTIGNSQSVVDHLAKHARIPPDRLRLVRGGIDVDRVQRAARSTRSELDVRTDQSIIFWAGRLDPVKGLAILIESFAPIARSHRCVLLLAGDGPLRGDLERQIATAGLTESVRFLGSRNDVPSLLKLADVFVFPSRTEGLPNALLEAMAAGCAVVTTDAPGCRDLIVNRETGLVVPYGDTRALTEALVTQLTNTAEARRMGERARQAVHAHWRITRTYDEYASIYRDIFTTS